MAVQPIEYDDSVELGSVHHLPTTRNDSGVADALQAIEQAAAQLRAALDQHRSTGGHLSPELTVLGERAVAIARGAHWQRTGRLD